MSSRKGFTLIEMIIVMAFLVVVGALLVSSLNNQALGNLDGEAQIISSRLSQTQTRAMGGVGGTSWGLHLNNVTSSFYALFQGSTYVTPIDTYYLSNTIQFQTPATGASTTIVFDKLTGKTTGTSTIIISLKSNSSITKTITVSATGKINIE
ncbi:prepilin-type N-terminal cleavage/methylation domain-containing protein [Candidatus Jorgensenbacteria bacterium]|nr:prepilin-type N-terminal cleavage/methylation domain-containing protein [Candidatus Jorgensenbacteria bacterium]